MNDTQIIGVYALNGVEGKKAAKLAHIFNYTLGSEHTVKDFKIDAFPIKTLDGRNGDLIAQTFQCNITDSYLIANSTLPVLYTRVVWVSHFSIVTLFKITLKFKIRDIDEIKSSDDLLKKRLYGEYSLELNVNDEIVEMPEIIDVYPGDDQVKEFMKEFILGEDMMELTESIYERERKELGKKYSQVFDYFKLPEKTVKLSDFYESDDDTLDGDMFE